MVQLLQNSSPLSIIIAKMSVEVDKSFRIFEGSM